MSNKIKFIRCENPSQEAQYLVGYAENKYPQVFDVEKDGKSLNQLIPLLTLNSPLTYLMDIKNVDDFYQLEKIFNLSNRALKEGTFKLVCLLSFKDQKVEDSLKKMNLLTIHLPTSEKTLEFHLDSLVTPSKQNIPATPEVKVKPTQIKDLRYVEKMSAIKTKLLAPVTEKRGSLKTLEARLEATQNLDLTLIEKRIKELETPPKESFLPELILAVLCDSFYSQKSIPTSLMEVCRTLKSSFYTALANNHTKEIILYQSDRETWNVSPAGYLKIVQSPRWNVVEVEVTSSKNESRHLQFYSVDETKNVRVGVSCFFTDPFTAEQAKETFTKIGKLFNYGSSIFELKKAANQ